MRAFAAGLVLVVGCAGPQGPKGEPGADGTVHWTRGDDAGPLLTLSEDTTWSDAQLLDRLVYVPAGVSLSIEAGVAVDLLPTGGLVVDGTLLLLGTEASPVVFRDFAAAADRNQGVSLGGPAGSTVAHARFDWVDLRLQNDPVAEVTDLEFSDATLFVRERSTPLTVSSCRFESGLTEYHTAIQARGLPALTVTDIQATGVYFGVDFDGATDGASLTVTDSTFVDSARAVSTGALGNFVYDAVVERVTVTSPWSYGLYFDDTDALVRDVTLTDALFQAIYSTPSSRLTVEDLTIDGAGSIGLHHAGDGLIARRVTISNVDGDGINAVNDAVVDDLTVTDAQHGLDADGTGLTASNLTFSGLALSGVEVSGDATVSDLDVDAPGTYGVYAVGDLDLSDAVISGSGNTGIYTGGDATLDRVTISDAGFRGLQIMGDLVAADLTVAGTAEWGIYLQGGGSLDRCELSGAAVDGIYVAGTVATEIRACDVFGNGQFGIRGNPSLPTGIDVYASNITGNASWGVYAVRLVDGNHVADNIGQVGADLGVVGVVDGVRDGDSTQIWDVDAIANPFAAPVPDTGPSPVP